MVKGYHFYAPTFNLNRIMMIGLLQALVNLDLNTFKEPPYATFAIIFIPLFTNLATTLFYRSRTNLEDMRRIRIASAHAQQEVMEAMKGGNQRRIEKAQKKQQEAAQAQMGASSSQMKTSFIMLIPLLLVYQGLRAFFTDTIVAVAPINIPLLGMELGYFNWYILCSYFTKTLLDRILGMTFEIEPAKLS